MSMGDFSSYLRGRKGREDTEQCMERLKNIAQDLGEEASLLEHEAGNMFRSWQQILADVSKEVIWR